MIKLNPIAIGTATQQYAVQVTENLCRGFCLTNPVQPQANITYSVGNISVVDGTAFVTINGTGTITYQPIGCNSCGTRVETFSESFVVAFVGTGTPTIALTQGAETQSAENVKCCNRAYAWGITTNLTIVATFPA
jgi:hypothetical protein